MTDTIDKLAQSFFLALILCSLMNDSYIIIINFTNNTWRGSTNTSGFLGCYVGKDICAQNKLINKTFGLVA